MKVSVDAFTSISFEYYIKLSSDNWGIQFWKTLVTAEVGFNYKLVSQKGFSYSDKFGRKRQSKSFSVPFVIPIGPIPIPGQLDFGPFSMSEAKFGINGNLSLTMETKAVTKFSFGAQYEKGLGLRRINSKGTPFSSTSHLSAKWGAGGEIGTEITVNVGASWPSLNLRKIWKKFKVLKRFTSIKRKNFKRSLFTSLRKKINGNLKNNLTYINIY